MRLVSIKDIENISHFLFYSNIEYNENTIDFYYKNDFKENLSNMKKNNRHTISMRKDILVDE